MVGGINNYTDSLYLQNNNKNINLHNNTTFGSSSFDKFNKTPLQSLPKDKLEISQKPQSENVEKKGLSTSAKWGIGTVAVLGLGALAYVLTKGKIGSKSVQQLAEHIEFKTAKTIEEAKAFAKENLGISKYKLENLEVANYVNEGLVNISNKFKGKAPMFKAVGKLPDNNIGMMSCSLDGKIFSVNEKTFLNETNTENINKLYENVAEECNASNFQFTKNQAKLLDKFAENPEQLNLNERFNLYETLHSMKQSRSMKSIFSDMLHDDSAKEFLKKNNRLTDMKGFDKLTEEAQSSLLDDVLEKTEYKIKVQDRGSWGSINHEFGHKLHREIVGQEMYDKMVPNVTSDAKKAWDKKEEYYVKFHEKYPNAYVLENVTQYATTAEGEAVAEIFAGKMNGMKYNDEIEAMYKEWKGPAVA